jgi:hypothetical protein
MHQNIKNNFHKFSNFRKNCKITGKIVVYFYEFRQIKI